MKLETDRVPPPFFIHPFKMSPSSKAISAIRAEEKGKDVKGKDKIEKNSAMKIKKKKTHILSFFCPLAFQVLIW